MKDRIWIIKFVLAGILLGVGLFMAFSEDVVYLMTGVILVIFALFRVFPLLKTLKHVDTHMKGQSHSLHI